MKFFQDDPNLPLTGDDANHLIRSLRAKIGSAFTVCSDGNDYKSIITEISEKKGVLSVFKDIIEVTPADEPTVNIRLFQAIPKSDKMEFIIQKAVELGVSEIIPIETDFTQGYSSVDFTKKLIRYNKIAKESAMQCNRGQVPVVSPKKNLKKVLQNDLGYVIMFYEENINSKKLQDLVIPQDVSIIIGAEGGFSKEEVKLAVDVGVVPVWLGQRILRCETASVTALSIIMYKTENL